MDVAAWLRGLGLERYTTLLRDHAIDADVLPELSDADLEKLGIPLGHRKRLLRAIAALRAASSAAEPASVMPRSREARSPPTPSSSAPAPEAWAT